MNRARSLLLGLVVVLALSGAISGVSAQISERPASIAIQQPGYVESDVEQLSTNGTPTYAVAGERINIRPRNFDSGNVVDFGVESETGALRYDEAVDLFVFSPEGKTGTYDLYWIVNRQVEVSDGNETANGTETVSSRYVARIRVTGQANLEHSSAASIDEYREDAENWRELNETIHSEAVSGPGADIETELQSAIGYLRFINHPFQALTGNFTAIGILLVTSLGGLLWVAFSQGYHVLVVSRIRKRLNLTESIEADEGELSERIAEYEYQESLRALQNMDWNDVFRDDHVAAAFRDKFGETVLDGWEIFQQLFLPRNLVRDRLQAMSQAGYVAVVDQETTGDGDVDATVIEDAHIEIERRVGPDETTVDLEQPSEQLLDAVDFDDPLIVAFDLPEELREGELGELDTTVESMDLDALLELLDEDLRHFSDMKIYGQYIRDFVVSVRDHPITDSRGKPDSTRYTLEEWLKASQLMSDRYAFPFSSYLADGIERALIDFRPGQRAEKEIRRLDEGRGNQNGETGA